MGGDRQIPDLDSQPFLLNWQTLGSVRDSVSENMVEIVKDI